MTYGQAAPLAPFCLGRRNSRSRLRQWWTAGYGSHQHPTALIGELAFVAPPANGLGRGPRVPRPRQDAGAKHDRRSGLGETCLGMPPHERSGELCVSPVQHRSTRPCTVPLATRRLLVEAGDGSCGTLRSKTALFRKTPEKALGGDRMAVEQNLENCNNASLTQFLNDERNLRIGQ